MLPRRPTTVDEMLDAAKRVWQERPQEAFNKTIDYME